jgi:cytochrome o ubiquinol oxidase subunit 2
MGPLPAAVRGRGRVVRAPCIMAPILLAGCSPDILDPAGPVGLAEKTILIDSLAIMLAIVVPTIIATFAFAFWFRASNGKAARYPDFAYSGRIELIVWSIPLMTIILLGGVAWIGSHQLDPARPLAAKSAPLDVQVVSLDWKWLFIYPDQNIASVNQLVIPVDVPIHFSLTSASVMNAFFIPRLGSMIYTMNGMTDQLNLLADQPGTFHGLSSHYSGDGFVNMHFDVRALPVNEFNAWIAAARNAGPTLDAATYGALARQGTIAEPFTFGGTEPRLYQRIVTQVLPPGPGPTPEAHPKSESSN